MPGPVINLDAVTFDDVEEDGRYTSRRALFSKGVGARDVIACPTGGAEVAHQIINTGAVDLVYLAVSTLAGVEVCEYPDSGKVSVYAPGAAGLRHVFRAADAVDYYAGEEGTGNA